MLMTTVFKSTQNINLRKKRLTPIVIWFTIFAYYFHSAQNVEMILLTRS